MLILGYIWQTINNFINSAKHQAYFDRKVVNDKRAADIKSNQLPTEVSCQPNSDLDKWQMAKSLASKSLNDELGKIKWSEQTAIRMICQELPTDSALFVGASRPTRDIEAVVSSSKKLQVFANRGLSGIDGNISTIFGLGQEFDLTHAIVGDLTLLHDVSAFSNPVANNIRIFVIDNNGGGIFSMLPASEAADFERLFATPHNLDLHQVLTGFSIKCSVVSNASELSKLLDKEVNGLTLQTDIQKPIENNPKQDNEINNYNDYLIIKISSANILVRKDDYYIDGNYMCSLHNKNFEEWFNLSTTISLTKILVIFNPHI